MPDFPRFLTTEEAAQLLGVSDARISMWIGECKLPVAARSEYAGFLLRTLTVETVGHELAGTILPGALSEPLVDAPRRTSRTHGLPACTALSAGVEPNHSREVHMS